MARKWKSAKNEDELIKKVARDTGHMPYQIRLRDGGRITAISGPGEETVVGEWTRSDD